MQTAGQYGVPDVPQFVVGRVPSAHSHMFTLSHDMSTLSPSSSARTPQQQLHSSQQEQHLHHSQQHLLQQQQNNNQMVAQKIGLGSDSPEVPSPKLVPPLLNPDNYNGSNNNNSNNGSNNNSNNNGNHKQVVPVGDDDVLLGGEDSERGSAGNRWPRQETLALLKIRSELDANFRDASLKGPLWEEVSRRLAELGYFRNSKKCKEKFENVHKYYKRTKEGRAGRQDGKNYRFFSQLEALYGNNHSGGNMNNKVTVAAICEEGSLPTAAPLISAHHSVQSGINKSSSEINNNSTTGAAAAKASAGLNPTAATPQPKPPAMFEFSAAISFSSDSSDDDQDEYDDEPAGEDKLPENVNINRKRKRTSSFSHSMMTFFENLMKQVVERQEAMQQKFLEAIEKREQDRMIREEAWKRQEMARLSREQEIKSQERSLNASRDAALVAFLQKVTGQTLQIPQFPAVPQLLPTPSAENMQNHHQHLHELIINNTHHDNDDNNNNNNHNNNHRHDKEIISFDPNSKRWPKPEVLALIKIRSGLEQRFHDAGPKGPLWEEISAGMACLGFNRSAKRCKEKWENINKYFRKAKESNKKRPENAKTCPYFHQLEALYRKKILGMNPTATASNNNKQIINMNGTNNHQQAQDHHHHLHRNLAVQMNPDDHDREMDDEDEDDDDDQDQDRQEEEFTEQQPSGSNREDSAGHNQGAADGADQILGMMQQPHAVSDTQVPHHHHHHNAVTYDRSNSSAATTRDTSFMAMVHKLTADPPEFNMSTSSNTE